MFEKRLVAGWGDMDFNAHMRNTAFMDKSADVRMMFFAQNGFPMDEFARQKLGPVIMRDEVEYFREIRLLEEFRVTLASGGLAPDGSRFVMRNEFSRLDGTMAARVTSVGGWLDLERRRLVAPPNALLSVMLTLERTGDFQILPSSVTTARGTDKA